MRDSPRVPAAPAAAPHPRRLPRPFPCLRIRSARGREGKRALPLPDTGAARHGQAKMPRISSASQAPPRRITGAAAGFRAPAAAPGRIRPPGSVTR
jgi:hypothetical protein